MNSAVERSVNLFKQTQGPLRCLSEKDPCNRNKSIVRSEKPRTSEETEIEVQT